MTTSFARSLARTAPDAYLTGVCLAANAMPGAAFRVDACQEAICEATALVARHDWCSTLVGGENSRVVPSDTAVDSQVVDIPRTRSGDEWWHGFADALLAAAGTLTLLDGPPRPGAVAVVGLPLDRLEADRLADRDEVVRLITRGLGVEVVSVWPSGEGPASLARAGEAGIIVSLPHGREAGRVLARRTGARLVEASLPVGLVGTARFAREVGAAVGRDPNLFLDAEMRRYAPRLEWVIPHALLHRRVRVALDPHLTEAVTTFLKEVGCREPDGATADLVLGPRPEVEAAAARGQAFLEAGFPSPNRHALHPTPAWLGFEGAMHLVETLFARLVQWEYVERVRRVARR